MPVYLIRAGDTDRVKIGWANDPEQRRRDLQVAHYEALSIIRLIDGPRDLERWLHHHFQSQWLRGEWHTLSPEMLTIELGDVRPAAVVEQPPRPIQPLSAEVIEARAKIIGISIVDACKKASIAPSTFYRWKQGVTSPSIEVFRRLRDATAHAA